MLGRTCFEKTQQEVGMPLIEVNGAKVYIEDSGAPPGRPDAPAIVFGHGLLFSGRMYAAQVARLKNRYRCVTIDWRGQGRSPQGPGAADMDTLFEDAAAIIEGLNAGPVHYVGLSMGGFVGIRLGARRPELLRSLSLLDTSSGPEDPDNVSKYRLLAKVYRLVGMRPVKSQVLPIMFGKTYLASEAGKAGVKVFLQELGEVKRPGMVKAILGVTDRPAVADELAKIHTPTLVIVGEEDVATPVDKSETIVGAIAGSQLEIVPQAGHSSTVEQPERLSDLLETFVDQH
jgi:3-oxoadipate enol-lactonase